MPFVRLLKATPVVAALARFVLVSLVFAASAGAQGSAWSGRVVDARSGAPMAGADVSIAALSRTTTTDSSGRFTFDALPTGTHTLAVRRIGFAPLSVTITAPANSADEQLFKLEPSSTELAKVAVVAPAVDRRLSLFETHRKSNYGGSFLTTDRLLRERGRPFADVLQTVAGSDIVRGRGSAAFFATRRGYDSFMNMPKARPADRARGASSGLCYAAVVVNNVFVYRGDDDEELFDLNQLAPDDVIAVEVYKGGATMPLEYNNTRKTCGLLVIYTR